MGDWKHNDIDGRLEWDPKAKAARRTEAIIDPNMSVEERNIRNVEAKKLLDAQRMEQARLRTFKGPSREEARTEQIEMILDSHKSNDEEFAEALIGEEPLKFNDESLDEILENTPKKKGRPKGWKPGQPYK